MDRVCIDASLAVAWLTYERYTAAANALGREWSSEGVELLAPPVFHAEVVSVLRQQVFFKRMLPEEGDEALSICLDIPVRIIEGQELYRKAWSIASELQLPTCYDSLYLAAAEMNGCEFWTADKKLVGAAGTGRSWVKWLGEYSQQKEISTAEPPRLEAPKQEPPKQAIPRHEAPNLDDPGLWRRF